MHMGGPFWVRRDAGSWSIPKGEIDDDEEPLVAARREFEEELGQIAPADGVVTLGSVRQAGGKEVTAFAVAGDLDVATIISDRVELEWPRGSGRVICFPEIDRAAWFSLADARSMLLKGQVPLLDRLGELLIAAGS